MAIDAPVLLDHKKRIEKVSFKFNPRTIELKVPVLTCEKTQGKFFHPDDIDNIIDALENEYNKTHQKQK